MRIVFVRHGHPNYALDCLTELGHEHAKAAAIRLENEGISEIHASSCGRAVETAQHTAKRLGLEVTVHDFIREIRWGSIDGSEIPFNGHPWFLTDQMVRDGQNVMRPQWKEEEPFVKSQVVQSVAKVEQGIDEWLKTLGYEREGLYYRVVGENTNRTVAMFSHGGSSSAALAHLLNLPFPFMCAYIEPDFTAITVLRLSDVKGELATPTIEICNDARHIHGGKATFDR